MAVISHPRVAYNVHHIFFYNLTILIHIKKFVFVRKKNYFNLRKKILYVKNYFNSHKKVFIYVKKYFNSRKKVFLCK